jgi:xylan 1,4-beta-xylosidase
MMKKRLMFLSLLGLLLSSCTETTSSMNSTTNDETTSSGSETSTSTIVDTEHSNPSDDLLDVFDEEKDMFDNAIKVPLTGGSDESADPFVYRYNGVYYLYVTTSGGYVRGYKSTDLRTWQQTEGQGIQKGYVYQYAGDATPPQSQTPFAPEVTYFNGKFYMIISPSGNGHYILESESPEGPFTCISKNISHNIDGSFFIDSDETMYVYYASSGSVQLGKLSNDFTSFDNYAMAITSAKLGNWNEGPYMLQRNGQYYLTYCGTHYLSDSYRVDYAYAPAGSDISKGSAYTREDTVVVSSDSDFRGLGHSSTVLGPDLDSYYIVYHNLDKNNKRYYNIARLSFNGASMVANDVRRYDNFVPTLPEFETSDDGNLIDNGSFLLSSARSSKKFTAEFNAVGEGKMVFSYTDENNYGYAEYINNKIELHKVANSTDNIFNTISLNHEFNFEDYNHTLRISYSYGKMSVYFDNIEKGYDISCEFEGGKIGYSKEFTEIGYTAFSNVANGSSDQKEYNSDIVLANAFDPDKSYFTDGSGLEVVSGNSYKVENSYNMVLANKDERATYRVFAHEPGYYDINMRVASTTLGKTIGVRVDKGNTSQFKISSATPMAKNGDSYINLGSIYMDVGQHNISIYNIDGTIKFSKITFNLTIENEEFDYALDNSFPTSKFTTRGDFSTTNGYLFTDNQNASGLLTNALYGSDVTVSTNIKIADISSAGYIGILLAVDNYSVNYSGDADQQNPHTYRGYQVIIDSSSVSIIYNDFNFQTLINYEDFSYTKNKQFDLKVEKDNNLISVYIDDVLIVEGRANLGNIVGRIGLMAVKTNSYVYSLSGE